MKSTRITFSDEAQYARLSAICERHGVTWRGLLIRGATRLESTSPFPDSYQQSDRDDQRCEKED